MKGFKHGGEQEHPIQASAGISFSVVLTESGKGSHSPPAFLPVIPISDGTWVRQCSASAQAKKVNWAMELQANASPQVTRPLSTSNSLRVCHSLFSVLHNSLMLIPVTVYVKEFDGKKIVQIASGQQHSIALEDSGFVFPLSSLSPMAPWLILVFLEL